MLRARMLARFGGAHRRTLTTRVWRKKCDTPARTPRDDAPLWAIINPDPLPEARRARGPKECVTPGHGQKAGAPWPQPGGRFLALQRLGSPITIVHAGCQAQPGRQQSVRQPFGSLGSVRGSLFDNPVITYGAGVQLAPGASPSPLPVRARVTSGEIGNPQPC